MQQGGDRFFVIALLVAPSFEHDHRDAERSGGLDAEGAGDVRDDDADFAAGQLALGDGMGDGHAVGAASADEDAEPDGPGLLFGLRGLLWRQQ